MSAFNVGLSGIQAANTDLSVTGNNIANASTTGFKSSRAEFGDLYSNMVFGSAVASPGSGVNVQAITQQFEQGNITNTGNVLDMAIEGEGFFVIDQGGEQLFTRSGNFGLDDEGYVVNHSDARLQGFGVDSNGNVDGVLGDIEIDASQQAPKQTTGVESALNLDSNEEVIRREGSAFSSGGNVVGVPQLDIKTNTTSVASAAATAFPGAGFDFSANSVTLDISLANAQSGNNGTVSVVLNTDNGVPQPLNSLSDAKALANVINAQLSAPVAPETAIDVIAEAVADGAGFRIDFKAITSGESSNVTVNPTANGAQIGLAASISDNSGQAAVANGYTSQSIDFTGSDGTSVTYTSTANATAAETASELNALSGVTAKAETNATILGGADFVNVGNDMEIDLNGATLTGNDLPSLASQINTLSTTSLPGMKAEVVNGDLLITSTLGDDIKLSISGATASNAITVQVDPNSPTQVQTLTVGGNAANNAIVVGGTIDVQLQDGLAASNLTPSSGVFAPFDLTSATSVVLNPFDANDATSFNHTTSVKIYDSLGNDHIMKQYFIKQNYDPSDPTTAQNHWTMVVRIDGHDVGDPDSSLPAPENIQPTVAEFDVYFTETGQINTAASDTVLISNWTPVDGNGKEVGSMGPINVLQGGVSPVPEPPASSNFTVDLSGSTQHGKEFSVNAADQNGYATGRLSGLSIDSEGKIFARFSNKQSVVLGQVALANFTNVQGLQPQGDTAWTETADSGTPVIGSPETAALGSVAASSLEDSNVDLSVELVDLIIAQRNYQANAKTIETANQVTQTIINLR